MALSFNNDQARWTSLRLLGVAVSVYAGGTYYVYKLYCLRNMLTISLNKFEKRSSEKSHRAADNKMKAVPEPVNLKRSNDRIAEISQAVDSEQKWMAKGSPLGSSHNCVSDAKATSSGLMRKISNGLAVAKSDVILPATERIASVARDGTTPRGRSTTDKMSPVTTNHGSSCTPRARDTNGDGANLTRKALVDERCVRGIRRMDKLIIIGAFWALVAGTYFLVVGLLRTQTDGNKSWEEINDEENESYSFFLDAAGWIGLIANAYFLYFAS